jgi:hypothetical protein
LIGVDHFKHINDTRHLGGDRLLEQIGVIFAAVSETGTPSPATAVTSFVRLHAHDLREVIARRLLDTGSWGDVRRSASDRQHERAPIPRDVRRSRRAVCLKREGPGVLAGR